MNAFDNIRDWFTSQCAVPVRTNASHRLLAETLEDYVTRLGRLGISQLGKGGFAQVFQHPTMPNVAVKLLVEQDPGYERYLKYCETKGKSNPYCPKILQVVKAEKIFDDTWDPDMVLVFMEKLTPITQQEFNTFHQYASSLANLPIMHSNNLCDSRTWHLLSKQKEDLPLAALAKALYVMYASDQEDFDLHKANIMKRGHQLVITDPFS